jgi:hypothetical protein
LFGFCLLGIASIVFAWPFKSRIIRGSPLEITVSEDQFLRVWNFTQVGGADRGAVAVTIDITPPKFSRLAGSTRLFSFG